MAGRPRKPDALKQLEGTYRPDRSAPNAPTPMRIIAPAPRTLSPHARKAWPAVSQILDELGVLTAADIVAVESLCECIAEIREARKVLRKRGGPTYQTNAADGSVRWKAHPEVAMIADLDRRLRSWLAAFGATPSDRSRVSRTIDDTPDLDDFDQYT